MALKHTNNEVAEVLLQNENLQTEKYIIAQSPNMKTYKNNSVGIKYGLSELSNDKTYLETELPARKRLKSGTELFNTMKYLNKICKVVVNDDESANFEHKEKYSGEISNILSRQGFENNPSQEPLKSELYAEINTLGESATLTSGTCNSVLDSNIVANQLKLDSNRCKFEKKLENHDYYSENIFDKNDDDKISNRGTESETEFDDEINKCCRLLNLDVPRIAVISTTDTKIVNDNFSNQMIENTQIHKYEVGNQILDTLHCKSYKSEASIKSMSNDENVNLGTISLDKKLKMHSKFLKNEKNCEIYVESKDEGNSVPYTTINSFSSTCENCININDEFFQNQINVDVENNSLETEFKDSKKTSTLKLSNILDSKSTSVKEPNIIAEMIQNHDNKSNGEHLGLTIENTLNYDTLKFEEIISEADLNDKDEVSSAVDDSGDILSLYAESDIDFDETKEVSKTNESESAPVILEETSKNVTIFNADHDSKICTRSCNKIDENDFIVNEKIDPVNDKNCESYVLDDISNNECIENNDFDIKVDESFVSEYEISLLEDTNSILSEKSE